MGVDPAPAVFMNICVGNISRTATGQDRRDAFAAFRAVQSASIIKDKFIGENRGFGFVPIVGFGRVVESARYVHRLYSTVTKMVKIWKVKIDQEQMNGH